MNLKNTLLLILLSAIWGFSFVFMRYLSPVFGPFITADMRLFIGGSILVLIFVLTGYKTGWKENKKLIITIGLINSGIPFLFYSFAALHIPGSVSSVINSLAPLFGAVFAAIFLKMPLKKRKSAGLLAGFSGVFLISMGGTVEKGIMPLLAMTACLGAAACYGYGSVFIKKRAGHLKPMAMAGTTQLAAGTILLPLIMIPAGQQYSEISLFAVSMLIIFSVLCSGLAYIIYFHLISEVGPAKALTVTFLIPVFGISGGYLVLGEPVSPVMLLGVAVVLTGTWLVTGGNKSYQQTTSKECPSRLN